ncbi:MAG TPA: DUF1559 domain-containing protein, partial [Gemmataceae bacterium]|nr:DUF1559 domain-containing protein [Gemmataceae bacterium]
ARIQCSNNLKQMSLAVINCSDTNQGLMPPGIGLYPSVQPTANNSYASVFFHICPYMEQDNGYKATLQPSDPHGSNVGPGGSALPTYSPFWNNVTMNVKTLTCPADPTNTGRASGWTYGQSSYGYNALVFPVSWAPYSKYPASLQDGTSNTMLFTEKEADCTQYWPDWGTTLFDAGYGQATGPSSLFQVKPKPCSFNVASSGHSNGINVGLGDGSVRYVSQGISGATWWFVATPAGGEVLGSDW